MVSGILSAAVSGLSVNAQRLGVAADNIANVSTNGYKRTEIQSRTISTMQSATAYAPGGVQAIGRQLSDVQGLLAPSASSTDLAISGNGFLRFLKMPTAVKPCSRAMARSMLIIKVFWSIPPATIY